MIIAERLDVTKIEHSLKHTTIFQYFDALEGGEGFVIENDHDPKPLYYQLQGERGNIFTWEYLKQGPDWWHVFIKKLHVPDDDALLSSTKEKTADIGSAPPPSHDVQKWPLSFLTDYIRHTHHRYAQEQTAILTELISLVADRHGDQFPELKQLDRAARSFFKDIQKHVETEEKEIFPAVKTIASGSIPDERNWEKRIQTLIKEHQISSEELHHFRKLTNNYNPPEEACESWRFMYRHLKYFDQDWDHHIRLENNVLFPKTLRTMKKMSSV